MKSLNFIPKDPRQYSKRGNTGLIVSRLSFGAMTFGKGVGPFATVSKVEEVTAQAMIGMSLDAGVSSPIFRPKRASGFHTFRHSAGSFLNEQTSNLKLAQRYVPRVLVAQMQPGLPRDLSASSGGWSSDPAESSIAVGTQAVDGRQQIVAPHFRHKGR